MWSIGEGEGKGKLNSEGGARWMENLGSFWRWFEGKGRLIVVFVGFGEERERRCDLECRRG